MNVTDDHSADRCGGSSWGISEFLLENINVCFLGYLSPALILFGLCGNAAIFFVLGTLQQKVKRMKADYEQGTVVTIVFMRAIAVFDILTLLTKFALPSCLVMFNIHIRWNQTLPFYAPLYNTEDRVFPFVQRILTPIGDTMQTIGYWITMLLLFQRLDQKCYSTAKSCCFVTRVGSSLLIFFIAVFCVGLNAQDLIFFNVKTTSIQIPCTERSAIAYVTESSNELHLFIPNQVAIAMRYALPFILMFLTCFGIAITLCMERKKIDSSQLLLYWDMRLHLCTFIISVFLLLGLAIEVSYRTCEFLSVIFDYGLPLTCPTFLHELFPLLSNMMNIVTIAIKFPIYFFSIKPFRQICACNTQDVSSDIGRAQYELYRYSLRREKRVF